MSTLTTSPTIKTQRILALILLIAQAAITVTGSIVRVTGSGLGCPTWPECQPGSLVPEAGVRPAIHQAIEWGNRLLTFPLAAVALLLFIAVLLAKRRKVIIVLSLIEGLGIIVQAVIGGISVWLNLRWWAVALHFLPSMILVFLAAILFVRIGEADDGNPLRHYPQPLAWLATVAALAMAGVLITGTMTTGAGVHAGDAEAGLEGRLAVDLAQIANIHAHFMYLYLGLTIGLMFALYTVKADRHSQKLGWWLIGMIIIQAAVGIIQYNFGVPRWTVPFHIGLSGVVVALTGMLYAHHKTRSSGTATVTGSPAGDARRARG